MRRTAEDVYRLQQKITRKMMDSEDGRVSIAEEDAVDIVFLLDLVREIKNKTDEIMK